MMIPKSHYFLKLVHLGAFILMIYHQGYSRNVEADSVLKVGAALCESGALQEGILELEKSIALAKKMGLGTFLQKPQPTNGMRCIRCPAMRILQYPS